MQSLGGLFTRAKDYARGFDVDTVANATDYARDHRAAQAQAKEDQIAARLQQISSGGIAAQDLSPEVFNLLGRSPRANENPDLAGLRSQVTQGVYGDGGIPADFRSPAGQQNLTALLGSLIEQGGETPSDALLQFASAMARAKAIRQPSLGAGYHGAMAGINEGLAGSGAARAALYGGIGGGAVAAIPLVTESGRALFDLMQNLQESQQQEQQSARGPQV